MLTSYNRTYRELYISSNDDVELTITGPTSVSTKSRVASANINVAFITSIAARSLWIKTLVVPQSAYAFPKLTLYDNDGIMIKEYYPGFLIYYYDSGGALAQTIELRFAPGNYTPIELKNILSYTPMPPTPPGDAGVYPLVSVFPQNITFSFNINTGRFSALLNDTSTYASILLAPTEFYFPPDYTPPNINRSINHYNWGGGPSVMTLKRMGYLPLGIASSSEGFTGSMPFGNSNSFQTTYFNLTNFSDWILPEQEVPQFPYTANTSMTSYYYLISNKIWSLANSVITLTGGGYFSQNSTIVEGIIAKMPSAPPFTYNTYVNPQVSSGVFEMNPFTSFSQADFIVVDDQGDIVDFNGQPWSFTLAYEVR